MASVGKRIRIVDLEFRNGRTPYSPGFDDIYFSPESGIDESRYVYLEGSGAMAAMHSGTPRITIGEIGFGAGLNFLLTLSGFRKSGNPGRMHYFSFENHPVRKSSLAQLYENYPELKDESECLLREYPVLTPGVHLLRFLEGRVSLYLCLGDAEDLLPKLEFRADHWYWDGFAPSRNPEAFSEKLFSRIAECSHAGTWGASFTAAGWVRRNLEAHGFAVEKRKGFGHKRECISASVSRDSPRPASSPWFSGERHKRLLPGMKVAVIGAGLGGSAIARQLAERNCDVTVFDPAGIAGRTSGNPAGLFNAQLSKTPNPISRFSQLSLACFIRELGRLDPWVRRGILRTDLHDPAPLLDSEYPGDFFEVREKGTFFPDCGIVDPREICNARMSHPQIRFERDALRAVSRETGTLLLSFQNREKPLAFDHIVYCLGADAKQEGTPEFRDPLHDRNPTRPIRGQILFLNPTATSAALPHALVEEGYATPPVHGMHMIGATYQAKTVRPDQEEVDTRDLLLAAQKWPEFSGIGPEQVQGTRIGYRLSTPDKLPMIGPLCDPDWMERNYSKALKGARNASVPPLESPPGEWLLTGLGSRGITYSSLGSEILAAWMSGAPAPLELDLVEHIHSARFFVRKLRKSGIE